MVAVGCPGVQYPVLPIRARRHQFLAVPDARLGEPLLCHLKVADAELPGQYPVRAGGREIMPPLNAEFDLAVAPREEVRVLGSLVGNVKTEPHVEVALCLQISDK